ncbi:PAS domain S-box protein [Salinarimonas ramus]|uniref:histidine kinase n=1 Tax=Salinarimonas ramus TaxID=690164 RepID=A0A917V5M5_9HYPH|nr:PAS domain S-box protein [Salinarimonas ramus]GGK40884.1 hypothetical protein GCM10011322_30010 [Salinarimonas ramus]
MSNPDRDDTRSETGRASAGAVEAWDAMQRDAILAQLAEGIIVADAQGRITFVNDAAERLHGTKLLGVAPDAYSDAYSLLTEDGAPHPSQDLPLARAVLHGERVEEARWRIRRPDGSEVVAIGSARPILSPDGTRTGAVLTVRDDTARLAAEAALRASEARLAFLDRLGAVSVPIADADAVLATTTRMLGEHLGLAICAYADMDADEDGFTIRGDWAAPASRSIVGRYRLVDFGALAVARLRAGEPLVVEDIRRDLPPEAAATFQAIGIGATVCMPLVKGGRLTALMAIHDRVPRRWTDEEISLLRAVTARSWAHVERVAAAAELRVSEARLTRAFEAGALGAWELDLTTLAAWRSPQHDRIFGYEDMLPEWTYGQFLDHIVPEDRARVDAAFQEAIADLSRWEFECRIRRADGEERWIAGQGRVDAGPDGTARRIEGMVRDVTGRRLAEERLRELNDTLARRVAERTAERDRIWRLSTDMMLVARFDGTIAAVNPAWTTLLGWSEAELVGADFPSLVHPDERAGTLAEMGRLGEGATTFRFENRYRARDGSYRWLSWTAVPEAGLIHAVGRDVTAEREQALALAKAEDALRQSQKLEAMGQLTGGVAHDFNNLLTPIIGPLDMLVRRGIGSERERRLLDAALQSAERAKVLVQRLLAFARRQPLRPSSVDIATLVGGMADLIGSTLGPSIEVRVDLAPDLPKAHADANQIEMALLNLGVNARDAMPSGGTLTIAAAPARVEAQTIDIAAQAVPALAPGAYVRLTVADTGIGMDEATRARAIEPFFSTKGIGKGTGLGLSMVHGLAAQLGGALSIESALGQGTRIHLWLPVGAADAAGAERPAGASAPAQAERGAALVVDDEELVRMSVADMLVDLGFSVSEATSGEEALRRLDEGGPFAILVTDHLMPGMSGVDLARAAQRTRPSLPILIVSGYADVETIAPDLPRLAKPFRPAELASQIARLLPEDGATG